MAPIPMSVDAPNELAAFLLTLALPLGSGIHTDVVHRDEDGMCEVRVMPEAEWSDELETRVHAAVQRWLYDQGIEMTTVRRDGLAYVLSRPDGAA